MYRRMFLALKPHERRLHRPQTNQFPYKVVLIRRQAMAADKSDWRSRDFENDDGHPPNSMPFVQFAGYA